jgi:hypothetical protein
VPDGFPTRSRHFLGPPQREPASARKLRAIRSDDGHYAEGLRKRKGENGKEYEEFKEFKEYEEFKKEPGARIQESGGQGLGTRSTCANGGTENEMVQENGRRALAL